jgi:hypothetical protein
VERQCHRGRAQNEEDVTKGDKRQDRRLVKRTVLPACCSTYFGKLLGAQQEWVWLSCLRLKQLQRNALGSNGNNEVHTIVTGTGGDDQARRLQLQVQASSSSLPLLYPAPLVLYTCSCSLLSGKLASLSLPRYSHPRRPPSTVIPRTRSPSTTPFSSISFPVRLVSLLLFLPSVGMSSRRSFESLSGQAPYDPPLSRRPTRGRSASLSANASRDSLPLPRRQSLSGAPRPPVYATPDFLDNPQIQPPLVNLYDQLDRSSFSDSERTRDAAGRQPPVQPYSDLGADVGVGPSAQSDEDDEVDRKARRLGRQSKGQEEPALVHVRAFLPSVHGESSTHKLTCCPFETESGYGDLPRPGSYPSAFEDGWRRAKLTPRRHLSQSYDITHSIDALENDVDQIVALRNKIASLKPVQDIGDVSIKEDLSALSKLTTVTGRAIVSLEVWLVSLHKWSKDIKALIKAGKATATLQELAEVKQQITSAKVVSWPSSPLPRSLPICESERPNSLEQDFADAMERIREGAYKEQARRERTRIWMAKHIRTREPDIDDHEVHSLLKAAELGAAEGVAQSHVTCVALLRSCCS